MNAYRCAPLRTPIVLQFAAAIAATGDQCGMQPPKRCLKHCCCCCCCFFFWCLDCAVFSIFWCLKLSDRLAEASHSLSTLVFEYSLLITMGTLTFARTCVARYHNNVWRGMIVIDLGVFVVVSCVCVVDVGGCPCYGICPLQQGCCRLRSVLLPGSHGLGYFTVLILLWQRQPVSHCLSSRIATTCRRTPIVASGCTRGRSQPGWKRYL